MKFYYKGVGYICFIEKKVDFWDGNVNNIIVRLNLPKTIFNEILLDRKPGIKGDIIIFKILKYSGEELSLSARVNNYFPIVENTEIWELFCYLNSSVILEYKEMSVSVNFDISVIQGKPLNKDEMRDILLNEILFN
jgi:hypothetical protein